MRIPDSTTRIHAIAALAFRTAVRSRLLLCMSALLLLVTFGLPATIAGDGTLSGTVRVLLDYTLGLSSLLLGVAMLWTSCAGVAREIETGHIRLIAVRPVHALELWLGKWLGLLAVCGLLLGIAGIGTYTLLRWKLHTSPASTEERRATTEQILSGQRRVVPQPDVLETAMELRLAEAAAKGWNPKLIPRAKALVLIRAQLLSERATVAPATERSWLLDLPRRLPKSAPVTLRTRISPSDGTGGLLAGSWTVTPEGHPERAWATTPQHYGNQITHIALPPGLARAGQTLRVTYRNDTHANTAVFDLERGVELLVRESSFASNLLRALLVVWCRLGLLCALGLAAGTCFSFPVAAFCASALVLLSMTGHYFITNEAADVTINSRTPPSAASAMIHKISEPLIHTLERLAAPAVSESPLAMLSDGVLVSWTHTLTSLLTLIILYGGTLALASAALLRRRELATGER